MRSFLLPLLLTAVAPCSCLPLGQPAPYVPSIRLPLSSPYAKFMWSQFYPDTVLIGAPNQRIALKLLAGPEVLIQKPLEK